jgi:hypothetical protein
LPPNGLFYGRLVHFVILLYIVPRFGTLNLEKSGSPGRSENAEITFPICDSILGKSCSRLCFKTWAGYCHAVKFWAKEPLSFSADSDIFCCLPAVWPGAYPTKSYKYWVTNICKFKYL